jgi:hypothetical protein
VTERASTTHELIERHLLVDPASVEGEPPECHAGAARYNGGVVTEREDTWG